MLLSDLSEKTLKPVPVETSEDSLFVQEQIIKGNEAALEFLSILNMKFVASDGSPHAATVLSAAAWLTGASLCQSLQDQGSSLPGTVITPQNLYAEWEHLVYLLEHYNFQRADIPAGRVVLAAMAAPPFFKPQVEMPYVQRKLQEQYHTVLKEHGFNTQEGPHVGIILCSILIQEYSRAGMIDIDAATGVVAQAIFEAARQCLVP